MVDYTVHISNHNRLTTISHRIYSQYTHLITIYSHLHIGDAPEQSEGVHGNYMLIYGDCVNMYTGQFYHEFVKYAKSL